MKKCPNCGNITESKFCPECGNDLSLNEELNICPNCGAESKTKFCPECGTMMPLSENKEGFVTSTAVVGDSKKTAGNDVDFSTIVSGEIETGTKKNSVEKSKKPKKTVIAAIIAAVVLLFGCASIMSGNDSSTSEKVSADEPVKVEEEAKSKEKEPAEPEPTESELAESESAESESKGADTSDPTAGFTAAQKNAYKSAQSYLEFMAFSKEGLIDQLSSEYGDGYDREDAEVAVEALEEAGKVDWVEQAKKSAQNYLDFMSFSKDGLIEQLESEYGDKYTHEQAVEAVEAVYK